MSEREEYLDELLKEMDGNSNEPEEHTREEGIVDNYDKELEGINEEEFLREFEKSLGEDLDADFETEFSKGNESNGDLEEELGLNTDGISADFMDNIDNIVNNVKNGTQDVGLGDGDLSIEESLKNFDEEDPDLDEIGKEFAVEDSYVNTLEEGLDVMGEASKNVGAEELSEAEKLAKEIESLNLEVEEAKSSADKEDKPVEGVQTQDEETKKGQKKGFFARLSAILFGEEEEEVSEKQGTIVPPVDIDNLSDENLSALMELENQSASAAAEEEEAKKKQEEEDKKAAKEQKAKEKEEKKAEKKAAKEQKAKEKAEKKALKKQSQEPVEKTKPLPKKPVALIVLFGLSVVVLVNLLSGVVGYSTAISDAKDYYAQGKYVEAYGCLNEKDMKEADLEFYNKVRLVSYLQQQLNSYEAYQSQSMYKEALAALIGSVGRYDRFIEDATEAGVDKEYTKMLQKVEAELSGNYQMSIEEARNIYALDDKKEFTYAVYDVIGALGLEEEP